jgi:hypothetical protein
VIILYEIASNERLKLDGKKVNQSHNTPMEAKRREMMYSSYSFTTSALDGVSGQRHSPAALYSRHPSDRSLGGPRAGLDTEVRGEILLLLPGIEPPPVRSQTLLAQLTKWNGVSIIPIIHSEEVYIEFIVQVHTRAETVL